VGRLADCDERTGVEGASKRMNQRRKIPTVTEQCAICGCQLRRTSGTYAQPTIEGRSGASRHHFVAERFFGRSNNRRGTKTEGIFGECPWRSEGEFGLFCYECHEELLHNPVILPADIALFAELVRMRNLAEQIKGSDRVKIAGRIALFHEAIARGHTILHKEETKRTKTIATTHDE